MSRSASILALVAVTSIYRVAAQASLSADYYIATVPNPSTAASVAVGVDLAPPSHDAFITKPEAVDASAAVSSATSTTMAFLPAMMPGIAIVPTLSAAAASPPIPTVVSSLSPIAAVAQGHHHHDGGDDDGDDNEPPNGECSLLGPFALIVQLALGGLALTSLVFKRWRERPQRPVKIWFFDVSKQVVGSVLVHVANVFMSMLTSGSFSVALSPGVVASTVAGGGPRAVARGLNMLVGRQYQPGEDEYVPNPCSFYLLNLAIDTTIGIPILIFLLHSLTALALHTPLGQPRESIQSGHYGSPPKAWWWLKQSFIYFCGLFGMKFCVLIIFLMFPWISRVGDWALGWTQGDERLQIIFSMMLFPLIMNGLQYYIIDSFIKEKKSDVPLENDEGDGGGAGDEAGVRRRPYDRLEHDDSEDGDDGDGDRSLDEPEAAVVASKKGGKLKEARPTEYDPNVDGDSSTGSRKMVGSIPQELVPKE